MFFSTTFDDLPDTIGVFPLDDVILLPTMQLTLNVFEPRYLNLVEDALSTSKLLAIVQPQSGVDDGLDLFSVACLGRVTAFKEDKHRLLISLEGVCRVRLVEELSCIRDYRLFSVDYGDFAHDFSKDVINFLPRERFMPLLDSYLQHMDVELSSEHLSHISDKRLIYSIAMLANFDSVEKQAILECLDIVDQSDMIMALIEMALTSSRNNGHDIV